MTDYFDIKVDPWAEIRKMIDERKIVLVPSQELADQVNEVGFFDVRVSNMVPADTIYVIDPKKLRALDLPVALQDESEKPLDETPAEG